MEYHAFSHVSARGYKFWFVFFPVLNPLFVEVHRYGLAKNLVEQWKQCEHPGWGLAAFPEAERISFSKCPLSH